MFSVNSLFIFKIGYIYEGEKNCLQFKSSSGKLLYFQTIFFIIFFYFFLRMFYCDAWTMLNVSRVKWCRGDSRWRAKLKDCVRLRPGVTTGHRLSHDNTSSGGSTFFPINVGIPNLADVLQDKCL